MNAISIAYRGVVPTKTSLIVPGFPVQPGVLLTPRLKLHQALMGVAQIPGPEADAPRALAHATVLLFAGKLTDPQALAELISESQGQEFGEMQCLPTTSAATAPSSPTKWL